MIKNLGIFFLVWCGGRYILDLDFARYYALATEYLSANTRFLFLAATVGSFFCVAGAFFLRESGFFSLMRLFGKTLFEASRSAIYFVSLGAVIFYFQLSVNLWQDLGFLAIIPFEALLASCVSLYLFDFNYPLAGRLLENVGTAILSGVIVIVSRLI
jgi:hypothetical protein